jgi:hypothetical protein
MGIEFLGATAAARLAVRQARATTLVALRGAVNERLPFP